MVIDRVTLGGCTNPVLNEPANRNLSKGSKAGVVPEDCRDVRSFCGTLRLGQSVVSQSWGCLLKRVVSGGCGRSSLSSFVGSGSAAARGPLSLARNQGSVIGIRYTPSVITDVTYRSLTLGLPIGQRRISQALVRAADSGPYELQDLRPADTKFKMLILHERGS